MKIQKRIINGLFYISAILIIWINFFEKYYISTSIDIDFIKFNRLIETIAISYLTSFIFYYIVVVLKENRDKKFIMPFVADYIYVAMNNCRYFCFSMRSVAGLNYIPVDTSIHNRNMDIYPNYDDLKLVCSKINPNKVINKDIGIEGLTIIPHFFGVMINYTYSIDYYIKIVLEKSNFLDIELLRILTDIQTHGFHQNMLTYDKKLIMTAKYHNDNLEVYERPLESYLELFKRLEKYADQNLKKHVQRESLKKK
jgi:hypothetical protein